MARRLLILERYAELCSLIELWVVHEIQATAGSLGYPRQAAGFSVRVQAGYVDPTGYSAWDERAVASSLEALGEADKELFAAVKMHYCPWVIPTLVFEGYPFPPTRAQTYYDRLERAHAWLQSEWRIELSGLRTGIRDITREVDRV